MPDDSLDRVERLFHDALAAPPGERVAFLESTCGDELTRWPGFRTQSPRPSERSATTTTRYSAPGIGVSVSSG